MTPFGFSAEREEGWLRPARSSRIPEPSLEGEASPKPVAAHLLFVV